MRQGGFKIRRVGGVWYGFSYGFRHVWYGFSLDGQRRFLAQGELAVRVAMEDTGALSAVADRQENEPTV